MMLIASVSLDIELLIYCILSAMTVFEINFSCVHKADDPQAIFVCRFHLIGRYSCLIFDDTREQFVGRHSADC